MTTDLERNKDPAQALTERIESALYETHTALPGRIEAFNAATQRATVRVQIKRRLDLPGQPLDEIAIPPLIEVPVLFPRAGGYALTFPVTPGDPCLVVFIERDIQGWLLSGDAALPPTDRHHDYSDAVAILGLWPGNQPITPAPSTAGVAIRNEAATKRVEITGTGTSIVSDSLVGIQAGSDLSLAATEDITALATIALNLVGIVSTLLASSGILTISATGALILTSVGPVTITRGANELLQVISEALDEIGTSTAGGDPLSNAAAIAALKAKIDAMRA